MKNKNNKHECKPLFNFTPGKVQSLIKEPEYSILPSRISELKGRQREIYDIIMKLNKNRLVVITGEKGIGKSSVMKNICHHMKYRNYYQNGIIFIS